MKDRDLPFIGLSPTENKAVLLLIALLVAAMLLTVLFSPVIYDTAEFGDTLFIVGAGWRDHMGLRPTLDFNHFYGGSTAKVLSWSFSLFGPTLKAFDYALVLLLLMASLVLAVICKGRVSVIGGATALFLIAALLLTRFPMEQAESLTRLVSTHSFLYNRIGFVIFVAAGLFAALPSTSRRDEVIGAVVVGALLVIAALTKPTFVVLIPAVLIALTVQARWLALLICVISLLATMQFLDPWATRWQASYDYIRASVGERTDAQVFPLIRKAVQIPLAQPIALILVLAAGMFILALPRRPWMQLLATGIMAAGGLGMAATMGGGGILGQLALPVMGLVMIVAAELAARQGSSQLVTLQTMMLVLVAAFALPHAANLFGTTVEAIARRDRILIREGPLANYLSVVEPNSEDGSAPSANQYPMLADGLEALRRLGDMTDRGIIADNGITFEFGMLAKPVEGYPLWPRAHSPELAAALPLPPAADLVLLGRDEFRDTMVGPILRAKLTSDFVLCQRTSYWEIFARRTTVPQACPGF